MSSRFGATALPASGVPSVPSIVFPAVGSPRRVLLVVGLELDAPVVAALAREGLAIVRVEGTEEARWFVGDRMPAGVLIGKRGEDAAQLVRWLRASERMAFVSIFLSPTEDSVAAALRLGADDAFDVIDEETAARMAARIHRAHALSQLALLDALTLLHNRRFMNDRLEAELARAARGRTPFSIALLDLDDFKTINDTFGHAAGDRVLIAFARALRTDLRAYDVPCRLGGDEFIVLFPDCDVAGATAAIEKFRRRAAWSVAGLPTVTFSAGVSAFPADGDDWTRLLDLADRRALTAKAGRAAPPPRHRAAT